MASCANVSGQFCFDQLLEDQFAERTHKIPVGMFTESLEELGWVKIMVGHRGFPFVPSD